MRHTLLFDARHNPDDQEGRRLVDKFAYLDQDQIVTCDPDTNDQNSEPPEEFGAVSRSQVIFMHHIISYKTYIMYMLFIKI